MRKAILYIFSVAALLFFSVSVYSQKNYIKMADSEMKRNPEAG